MSFDNDVVLIKKKIYIKPLTVIVAELLLMSIITSEVCLHEIYSGVFFTLFMVFGVMTPGIAGIYLLGWAEGLNLNGCGLAFVLGYCITLFEYFILMILNIKEIIQPLTVVVAIISIVYVYFKLREQETEHNASEKQEIVVIIVFTSLLFVLSFFSDVCNNLVQPVVNECSPNNDMLYWIGNIIELTKEFPPKDYFNYPLPYSYHYFSSAQLAYVSMATGIRPIYTGLYFSVVQSVMLRLLCAYIVVTKCTDKEWLQVTGLILLFFASGFESIVRVSYLSHLYYAPFGLEYALAVFLIFLYLIIIKTEEPNNLLKTSVLIWMCLFVLAGEKIAYGGIAILGLGILCIGFLIKKEYKKAFITGIPALGIFLAEFFFMINTARYASTSASGADESIGKPIYNTYLSEWYEKISETASSLYLPEIPSFVVLFMMFASPVCFFAVVYNIWRLTKNKSWSIIDVMFLIMYVAGFLITISCTMIGRSNMYFAMVSFPVSIIWLLKCNLEWGKMGKTVLYFLAVISIIGMVHGHDENKSLFDYINNGTTLLKSGTVRVEAINEKTYADREAYEAYEWLRENSDENSIIAKNRESKTVGVMAERHTNDPRFDNSIFTKDSDEERAKALEEYRETGVEYILYESKYKGKVDYIEENCPVVYRTDNITIFSVK